MRELVDSEKQRAFGQHKLSSLPKYCRECEVRFACHGECPRNRFITTPDGEPGLNYLCAGYKAFFNHIDPAMKIMAGLLRQGRFADEIMQMSISQARRHADGCGRKSGATIPAHAGAGKSSNIVTGELPRARCFSNRGSKVSHCLVYETIGPLVWRIREG